MIVEVTCPICCILHDVEEEKVEVVKKEYKHLEEYGWRAEDNMLCKECAAFCRTI